MLANDDAPRNQPPNYENVLNRRANYIQHSFHRAKGYLLLLLPYYHLKLKVEKIGEKYREGKYKEVKIFILVNRIFISVDFVTRTAESGFVKMPKIPQ